MSSLLAISERVPGLALFTVLYANTYQVIFNRTTIIKHLLYMLCMLISLQETSLVTSFKSCSKAARETFLPFVNRDSETQNV